MAKSRDEVVERSPHPSIHGGAVMQARSAIAVIALVGVLACGGSPTRQDGGSHVDAAPHGDGGTAAPCVDDGDCASGICLDSAGMPPLCTEPCDGDSACPDGANWRCLRPEGYERYVCTCGATGAAEVCDDGLDNDCNGRMDDCLTCGGRMIAGDDDANCGACGVACAGGQLCRGGECLCPAGQEICDGLCVDTQTNRNHCGACGNLCGADRHCVAGSCECPAEAPDACGDRCADLSRDRADCGACDNACDPGLHCSAGVCACSTADAPNLCPGAGCVDFATSDEHCGACGHRCEGGEVCVAGSCACAMPGRLSCGGSCVDVSSDPNHCGACGATCPASEICSSGSCRCPLAGTSLCGASCVSLDSDTSHCGSCGTTCGPGESCRAGVCGCESGLVCGGVCVPTDDPSRCGACGVTCPADTLCRAGACGCSAYGLSICGGVCVDRMNDTANCGACGTACLADQICVGGSCQCPPGQSFCAAEGRCRDLASDASACGACGNVCLSGQTCRAGTCQCNTAGERYCASVAACVDTQTDALHCGACDNACLAALTCVGGACVCGSGQTYCSSAGACVDTRSDALHCGACDNACPAGASCGLGSCSCSTVTDTPCLTGCTDTLSDGLNCGACGNVCSAPFSCVVGACLCEAPTVGGVVRVSTTVRGVSGSHPQVAASPTRLAVLYHDTDLMSAVVDWRNTDGTDDGTPAVELQSYLTDPLWRPSSVALCWTGTEFGVAFTRTPPTGRELVLLRFSADGTLLAPPSYGATDISSGGAAALAYSAAGGYTYAVLFNGVRVVSLGADGTTRREWSDVRVERSTRIALAVAPDGRMVVAAQRRLYRLNPDLTPTAGIIPLAVAPDSFDVVHDGVTWVLSAADERVSTSSTTRVRIFRGEDFEHGFVLPDEPTGDFPVLTTLVHHGNALTLLERPSVGGGIRATRLGTLASPTTPSYRVTTAVDLPAGATMANTYRIPATAVSSTRAFVAWPDTRWTGTEIAGATLDVTCP